MNDLRSQFSAEELLIAQKTRFVFLIMPLRDTASQDFA
jgi:hypothetical protein